LHEKPPLVVIGAPLAIDANSFKTAGGDVSTVLSQICAMVHGYGDIPPAQQQNDEVI
jgi:3-hexulose-6-phosphate synthase